MADSKKYNGSTWEHSLRKLTTATDTFTTLPVDVYADGNTATVSLKGNTVQNGTPTPSNPIMPQGTGERTGNLAYGRIDDANIDATGTIGRLSGFDIAIGRVESGVTYTANTYAFAFFTNEPTTGSVSYDGSRIVTTQGKPSTFTAPITGYVAFRLDPGEPAMLNTGSTALPYEPYGYKIPISSANTTTPVYLGEVESTRRIKKLVLTGNDDWIISDSWKGTNTSVFYLTVYDILSSGYDVTIIASDKFLMASRNELYNGDTDMIARTGTNSITIRISDSIATTVAQFKSYLQQQYSNGTPVTIWYVLATEETGIVNEPLMKIGDYADTVSSITVPMITGRDTFDVETTLKPSEVSLSYTGWHDATVEEWDGSQWNE